MKKDSLQSAFSSFLTWRMMAGVASLVLIGSTPMLHGAEQVKATCHVVALAPSSLDGYELSLDTSQVRYISLGSTGSMSAQVTNCRGYENWSWGEPSAKKLPLSRLLFGSDTWQGDGKKGHYQLVQVARDRLLLKLTAEGGLGCDILLWLDFKSPLAGVAIWNEEQGFDGNIKFTLVKKNPSSDTPAPLPQPDDEVNTSFLDDNALIIIDDMALCVQHGQCFFSQGADYSAYRDKQPLIKAQPCAGKSEVKYLDQSGREWLPCQSFSFEDIGDLYINFSAMIAGQRFELFYRSFEDDNDVTHYREPAEYVEESVDKHCSHGRITGYFGSSTLGTKKPVKKMSVIRYAAAGLPLPPPAK